MQRTLEPTNHACRRLSRVAWGRDGCVLLGPALMCTLRFSCWGPRRASSGPVFTSFYFTVTVAPASTVLRLKACTNTPGLHGRLTCIFWCNCLHIGSKLKKKIYGFFFCLFFVNYIICPYP